ncbi:ribose ABC transporter permease [Aneurinibacillus sp. Ricciae_BoGa-3]|uniref:ABC transporter permease n=1 Tax=Aneurinibacillus sp. Ricciae_BoGa-3 TaxID=3022697 RepID=UPI002340FAE1|nr:ribose ABC transporter permease [Aneurinibacillus sp. Ricciae_BoGa-3]WCK56293.1 ribose ABC transporter permease [Aneurinibacillus sp. Ricciae_BoGa-3]
MGQLSKYRTLFVLLVIVIIASFLSNAFFTTTNLLNIARQVSITAIVGAGMTLVILVAGIDLSVGAVLAVSGAIVAGVLASTNSVMLAILVSLIVGIFFGSINGFLSTKGKMPSFIVTLATMAVARALTLVLTNGYPVVVRSSSFREIGNGHILGVPIPVILMVVIFVLLHILLKHTKLGRYIYSVGGNESASRLTGINTYRVIITTFILSGIFTSIASLIYTARLSSAQPTAGTGLELDAIAAVILGGTSLAGGQGGVFGTLIGAFIMGILDNILNLMNINPYYQGIVKGVVIILAVFTDNKFRSIAVARFKSQPETNVKEANVEEAKAN